MRKYPTLPRSLGFPIASRASSLRHAWPLLAATLFAVVGASAQSTISILAPPCVALGSTGDIALRGSSGATPQGAAQFHLLYDPAVWSVDASFASGGYRLDSGWAGVVNVGLTGEVFAAIWHLPPEPTGNSDMLTVRLVHQAGAIGATSFDCTVDRWVTPVFVDIRATPFASPTVMTQLTCGTSPPSCAITSPAAGSVLMTSQVMTFNLADPNNDPCTISYEFNAGGFQPASRVGGGASMDFGVLPATGLTFNWNLAADFTMNDTNVQFRVTVNDGSSSSTCGVVIDVLTPNVPPTCNFTSPPAGGTVLPAALMLYNAVDGNGDLLTLTHEYNGGAGLQPATRVGGGSHIVAGVPPGGRSFVWDAAADVGSTFSGAVFRVTVSDGRGGMSTCMITVNVAPPGGSCPVTAALCGDCNGDGNVNILDALVAGQSGASLISLSPTQFDRCNVQGAVFPSAMAAVNILDALRIAQIAAGLPVALTCC